jgi:CheY-like chemotaxis protein
MQRPQATYNIVLIEDDVDTCEVITESIESQSRYRVRSLSSGEAVLEHIQEISEAAPAFFIIDYLLPGMNGLELFDHLRSFEALEQVPSIILTAASLNEDLKTAIRDRNLALISKPFELENLIDHLECVLSNTPQQLLS